MQSQRQLRVGEQVRHILVETLQRGHFRDPDLMQAPMITITEVRISPDLKNATAFIMPLGGQKAVEILSALNRATGYFRSELGRKLELRFTPRVDFKIDDSFENAEHIESLLRQERVQKDLRKSATDNR